MVRGELKGIFGPTPSALWVRALLFAAVYFLCAEAGNFLTPPASARTYVIFWLPAGLYVAVLLLHAPRHWGWFIAAALPANLAFDLTKGTPFYLMLAFYASNTVQATLGAWLVQKFVARSARLRTVKEFFGFIALAGIFSTMFGALIGAGALYAAGLNQDFFLAAKVWWGSCAMAVLLFSPVVLAWCDRDDLGGAVPISEQKRRYRIIEGIALYGGLIVGTWLIFLMSPGVTTPYKFRTLPFLVWAGLRFGRRGAATANLIYAALVVYSASHAQEMPALNDLAASEVTFTVQTFLVVAALVGLVPAITLAERDAALVRLRESETHYRNLTEAAFEGVCISEDGRLLDVSDQLLNMIRYERNEVLGRQIPEFIAPEFREAVIAALRAEKEAPYGVQLVRKDGSTFHCEVRAKVVQVGGRTLRMTAVRDITERIKAEEALRASEARLRAVSDNLPNGIVYQVVREKDGVMRFLHVSAGVERIHGVTAEAVLRDPQLLYAQILPEDLAGLATAEEKSFATMTVFDEIMRIRRSDGEIRWVRLCSAPRRKPDGRIIWDGIEIDITESKRAEEALRHSEEKFSKAFLSSPSSMVITRQSDGRIMEANDAFCRRYGIDPDKARGQTVFAVGVWRTVPERDALIQRLRREGSIRNVEKETILPSGRRTVSLMSLEQITIRGEECLLTVTHDITDLKQAEQALQESEAKFRTLFNTAHDAIFLMNRRVFLDCNAMTEVMFSCGRAEIIGRSPVRFSPETQADGIASAERAVQRIEAAYAGTPQFFEWIHQRADGTTFPAEVSLNRVELRGVQFLQAIVRDITARKQAEARLKILTDRLKLATDAAAIAVWEWNLQTNEVLGNERLFEIYGYPVESNGRFSYEQWRRLVHPDDLAEQETLIQKTIATKGQSVREFRAYRLDGKLRHIHAADITLTNDHGEVTRIVGVNIDITERKTAEEALRENQRMLATLMANLPGLVYRCRNDVDWTMEFVSDGCIALTGFRPEDLRLNQTTSFAALIHPDDRTMVAQMVQAAIERHSVFELNYRIHTASGEEKWVWERGQGVYAADGTLLMLEGFISDITAQRKAEAEREAATKREQSTRAEFTRQLIASQEAERTRIAREIHDHLGQLLTALKLDLRSLERRASVLSDTDLQAALLGKIGSAKELADETITSVQKIASELRPGILDRLGLAAAIEAEAQTFAARTGLSCNCSVPEETPPLPQDRAIAAFRIFQEIMTNVARHAHATELSIQLTLSSTLLELTVEDNGVGLADQHFSNPKSFGLLGMMERAEIIGGQIKFRKRDGGSGTVVAVRLPLGETRLPNS